MIAVQEKLELGTEYRGRIKITNKEAQEFTA